MPEPAPVMAATRPLKSFMSARLRVGGGVTTPSADAVVADGAGELHDGVLDVAHLQRAVVAQVALVHPPGVARALLGQQVGRALDVARRQPEQRAGLGDRGVRGCAARTGAGRARACG